MNKLLTAALCCALALAALPARAQPDFDSVLREAEALAPLETLIVARDGEILLERGFRGHQTTAPTNIKSASKAVISALVGIAIGKGLLDGPEQKVAPLLADKLPADRDPRLDAITLGHLLSMQAGLGRTSGPNYGRWVASDDWVRAALAQPFVGEPGGGMLYSTGNTHLLSAILTRVTGRSTLALARAWLAPLEGFAIADWMRDPQGIYFGGNQMAMSPRSLLAFAELYRNGGRAGGEQVLPPEWIEQSWQPRTQSVFHDDLYGYGWFLGETEGHRVAYAWGYGGQMAYVVPDLALSVVMTSADNRASARSGHRDDLHALLRAIVAAVKNGEA
ncbi:MAG TPA: serine hydrolase [Kiloniellaceae bacterium]|nr:serine hydrolase [Kiloniellaceae bacterium]